MSRYAVYRNPNPATRATVPLLLDVQSDLLAELATRVVVPLCTVASMKGRIVQTLMPQLDVAGRRYVMVTPQLAGIARKPLGEPVAELSAQGDAILAALDFLVSGF